MILSKINRSLVFFIKGSKIFSVYSNRIFSTTSANVIDSHEQFSSSNISEQSFDQSEHKSGKGIPVVLSEFKERRNLKPCQPNNPHLLFVSILGEPNAGKSTLTNKLVKWKVCGVSKKVHTTRKQTTAVFVEDNKQIVFLDTPGFVTPEITKKHHLEPTFVMDPLKSVRQANIIAVVVDIANKWTNNRINENILQVLQDFKEKKSILILNKVDAMKSKNRLLSFTRILTCGIVDGIPVSNIVENNSKKDGYREEIIEPTSKSPEEMCQNHSDSEISINVNQSRGWPLFSKVFMVSALKDDGLDDLRNYLLSEALPKDWLYSDNEVTDEHPHNVALAILREKLLEYLPEEIPYLLDLQISKWEVLSNGSPNVEMKIICRNSRHKRFVIGPQGKHIASCVANCRKAMKESFKREFALHIAVV